MKPHRTSEEELIKFVDDTAMLMLDRQTKRSKKEIFDTIDKVVRATGTASMLVKNKYVDRIMFKDYISALMWYSNSVEGFLRDQFIQDPTATEKFAIVLCCFLDKHLSSVQLEERVNAMENPSIDDNIVYANMSTMVYVMKLLISQFHYFCPSIEIQNPIDYAKDEIEVLKNVDLEDGRRSDKSPSNPSRIKALEEFCPELWRKLEKSQNKDFQKEIIHLITATNKEDSYKLSFGSRQDQRKNQEIKGLSSLKTKLNDQRG